MPPADLLHVAHLKASCGDDAIRSAMRLAPGEAMLLLDEVCFNRLCRPVMRSLSYYTNFFDFSILRSCSKPKTDGGMHPCDI